MADGRVTIDVDIKDKGASRNIKDLENGFNGVGKAATSLTSKFAGLVAGLGVVKLLQSAFTMLKNSIGDAVSRVDTLNRFPMMMEAMGFSAQDAEGAIGRLSDGIQGLPTRLDEVAATAQNIAILTGDLDLATDTTLALNNAFLASGSSTEDAKRGLQQYVQMLSRGEVDMQSWRTLQETMGVALNDTAKAFGFTGRSAQNDLYEALKSGNITFDQFNSKLIEMSEVTGGFADRALIASRGIRTSMTNIRTAVVTGLANTIQTVDAAMQAGGFGSIADNLDKVKEGVKTTFSTMNGIIEASLPTIIQQIINFVDVINTIEPALYGLAAAFAVFQLITNYGNIIYELSFKFLQLTDGVKTFYNVLTAHPYATIAAVIIGLIVTVVRLWQTNEDFRNAVINIWNAVKNAIGVAIDFIKGLFESLGISLQSVGEWFSGVVDRAKELGGAFLELAGGVGNTVIGFFSKLFTAAVQTVGGFAQIAGSALITWFGSLGGHITNVGTMFGNLKDRAVELWETFQNSAAFTVLASMFEMVQNKVSGFRDAFVALVRDFDFGPMLEQIVLLIPKIIALFVSHKLGMVLMGVQLIQNIAEGLGMTVPELIQKVTETIVSVIEKFAEQLPQFIEAGTNMLISVIEGIVAVLPQLVNTAVEIILTVVEALLGSIIMLVEVGVTILTTLIDGIVQVLPILIEVGLKIILTLVEAIIMVLPQLVLIGLQIITTLLNAVLDALPVLIEAGIQVITTLLEAIITTLPVLIEAGINIIMTLLDAIISALPVLIDAGIQIVITLLDAIITMIPALIEAGITLITTLLDAIIGMLPALIDAGVQLITSLVTGIIQILPALIEAGISLVQGLTEGLIIMIPALIMAGIQIIQALIQAIIQLVPALLSAGVQLITALAEGALSILDQLAAAGITLINGLISAISGMVQSLYSAGAELITNLVEGVSSVASTLYTTVTSMITETISNIKGKVSEFTQAGRDVIGGFVGGVGEKVGDVVSKVVEVGEKTLGGIKSFLGIQSPSTEMIAVGKDTIQGLINGITAMISKVASAATDIVSKFSNMVNNVKTVVSNGFKNVSNIVSSVMNSISSVVSSVLNTVRNVWNTGITFLSTVATRIFNLIRTTITNVLNTVKNVITSSLNAIRSIWSSVTSFLSSVTSSIFNLIRSTITNAINGAKNAVTSGMNGIRSIWSSVTSFLSSVTSSIFNSIRSTISSTLSSARSTVSSILNSIKNTFTNVFNTFKTVVSSAFSRVKSAISTGMSNALSVVTGFVSKFKQAGTNIVSGIADGIKGAVGKVGSAMSGVAQKARNFLPFSPAKEGPLRDAHKSDFGWMFETAIGGAKRNVSRAMNNVLETSKREFDKGTAEFGVPAINLPNTRKYMPTPSNANVQSVNNTTSSNKTVYNDKGVTINIEHIDNNTDEDVPRILEQAAWILNREERG